MNWISIEKRLPPPKTPFLGTDGDIVFACYHSESTATYIVGGWQSCGECGGYCDVSFDNEDHYLKRVTHWMPIPPIPQDDDVRLSYMKTKDPTQAESYEELMDIAQYWIHKAYMLQVEKDAIYHIIKERDIMITLSELCEATYTSMGQCVKIIEKEE